MWWQEPVSKLKGIGPKKALEFANINVETIGDLLNHFPRQGCYLDYSHILLCCLLLVFLFYLKSNRQQIYKFILYNE